MAFALNGTTVFLFNWMLKEMQLVSLFAFDEPKVYVLDHMPRMEDLVDQPKTRDLTKFELQSLERLRQGENLTHRQESPSELWAFGAIRADHSCQQCHDVPEHELLGAFSYRFVPFVRPMQLPSGKPASPNRETHLPGD